MKFSPKIQIRQRAAVFAFTLPEIIITSAIFATFIVGGMIALQLFGIRTYQLTGTKLIANADSLKAMNQMRDQIRGAASVQVGYFSSSNATFRAIGSGTNQNGNALQVFPTTNTASYVIFYRDDANTNLYYLYNNQTATTTNPGVLLARWISNTNCFQAQDYRGTNLSVANNNCTIRITLQFFGTEYDFGNGKTNFFLLQTAATPRSPDLSGTVY